MSDANVYSAAVGARATRSFVVAERDTAEAVGSGVVPVLGTPVLVAWLEATTLDVVEMPPGAVSLGVHVDVAHLAPTALGTEVVCEAELVAVDGLRLTFDVAACNSDGTAIGRGTIARVVVDRTRFLARLD